ncbi:MAG TPA: Ig-like domain-containing protein, partial [Paludibacter sp.]
NPNHNDGYVGIMIAAWYYFGGTAAVNQILTDFKYDTYISTFTSLHFNNIVETWTAYGTTTYPTGTNSAAMKLLLENPTGSVQADKGGGKVYGARMPFVFGTPPSANQAVAYTPQDLYKSLGAWMYPFTVTNKSTAGLAYILNNGSSPMVGKTGMCREFQVTDGFVPNVSERSDAQYCWWGWMMHIPVVSAMMALGDWPVNNDIQDTERRMYVGSEDLMYKLRMGYHSYSKAVAHDYYDYQYASQGYWYIVDIWNNIIKKRINKEPFISITSPVDNSVILSNASITLSANAFDNEGYIKKVEFYNGTKKMGEVTSIPFSHTWSTGLPVGDYNFIAKACDDDGLIKSDSIKFTVKADPSSMTESKTEQLSVFPNPTDNYFKLFIPDDARRIKVFDLKGKLVHDEIVTTQTTELGNNWNTGIYILKIEFSKGSNTFQKLIKI